MIGSLTLSNEFSYRMTISGWFSVSWPDRSETMIGPHRMDARQDSVATELFLSPVANGRSTCQSAEIYASRWENVFTPRTDLGKRLYALRKKAVNAGMKLLSEDEVLAEVKARRGEFEENETNLY
jgi:hypothetical protein